MEPLDQKAFPLGDNVRRAVYWIASIALAVTSYLGAREAIDSIDMAFVTSLAVLVTGMAGVNTPASDK